MDFVCNQGLIPSYAFPYLIEPGLDCDEKWVINNNTTPRYIFNGWDSIANEPADLQEAIFFHGPVYAVVASGHSGYNGYTDGTGNSYESTFYGDDVIVMDEPLDCDDLDSYGCHAVCIVGYGMDDTHGLFFKVTNSDVAWGEPAGVPAMGMKSSGWNSQVGFVSGNSLGINCVGYYLEYKERALNLKQYGLNCGPINITNIPNAVDNIGWSLEPASIFVTDSAVTNQCNPTTEVGATPQWAEVNFSAYYSNVEDFSTNEVIPFYETFSAQIWPFEPREAVILGSTYNWSCDEIRTFTINADTASTADAISWNVSSNLHIYSEEDDRCQIVSDDEGPAYITTTAINCYGQVYHTIYFDIECYIVMAYPNPASDELTVEIEHSAQFLDPDYELELINDQGIKKISIKTKSKKSVFDVSKLQVGTYVLSTKLIKKDGGKIGKTMQIVISR